MRKPKLNNNIAVPEIRLVATAKCDGALHFVAGAYRRYEISFRVMRNGELKTLRDDICSPYTLLFEVFGNTRGYCEHYESKVRELVERYSELMGMKIECYLLNRERVYRKDFDSDEEFEDEFLTIKHSMLLSDTVFSFDDDCIRKVAVSDLFRTAHYVGENVNHKVRVRSLLNDIASKPRNR